jgi:hypothetical protein
MPSAALTIQASAAPANAVQRVIELSVLRVDHRIAALFLRCRRSLRSRHARTVRPQRSATTDPGRCGRTGRIRAGRWSGRMSDVTIRRTSRPGIGEARGGTRTERRCVAAAARIVAGVVLAGRIGRTWRNAVGPECASARGACTGRTGGAAGSRRCATAGASTPATSAALGVSERRSEANHQCQRDCMQLHGDSSKQNQINRCTIVPAGGARKIGARA